jgi:hypothetical protein
VQHCSTAAGHSSRVAFQIPGAPSAMTRAGGAHPARLQITAEVQPALVALARPELQPEQHLLALQGQAPGDQYALGRLVVGPQLQIDRVQVAVREPEHDARGGREALAVRAVGLPANEVMHRLERELDLEDERLEI